MPVGFSGSTPPSRPTSKSRSRAGLPFEPGAALRRKPTMHQHLIGCLWGTALGDALGLCREGLSPARGQRLYPDLNRFQLFGGRGLASDDTEHAAFTAWAIHGHPDPPTFQRRLRHALRRWIACLTGRGRARKPRTLPGDQHPPHPHRSPSPGTHPSDRLDKPGKPPTYPCRSEPESRNSSLSKTLPMVLANGLQSQMHLFLAHPIGNVKESRRSGLALSGIPAESIAQPIIQIIA